LLGGRAKRNCAIFSSWCAHLSGRFFLFTQGSRRRLFMNWMRFVISHLAQSGNLVRSWDEVMPPWLPAEQ